MHRDVEDEFVSAVQAEIKRRYGSDPRTSADFGRVVNSGHTQRIKNMLDAGGYQLVCGGQVDVEQRYVAPTVLRSVEPDAGVMQDEIFGPVLPVIGFDEIDEPIAAINAGDKPLALYVFTDSDKTAERVKAETSSGGLCINDVIIHIAVNSLPVRRRRAERLRRVPRQVGLRHVQPREGGAQAADAVPGPAGAATAVQALEDEADAEVLLTCAARPSPPTPATP